MLNKHINVSNYVVYLSLHIDMLTFVKFNTNHDVCYLLQIH